MNALTLINKREGYRLPVYVADGVDTSVDFEATADGMTFLVVRDAWDIARADARLAYRHWHRAARAPGQSFDATRATIGGRTIGRWPLGAMRGRVCSVDDLPAMNDPAWHLNVAAAMRRQGWGKAWEIARHVHSASNMRRRLP